MKKTYKVGVSFDGRIHYEIDAKTEYEAVEETKSLFNDENSEILLSRSQPFVSGDDVTIISTGGNL